MAILSSNIEGRVGRSEVVSVIESLGLRPNDIHDIRLSPDGVYVTAVAFDRHGKTVVDGNEVRLREFMLAIDEDR